MRKSGVLAAFILFVLTNSAGAALFQAISRPGFQLLFPGRTTEGLDSLDSYTTPGGHGKTVQSTGVTITGSATQGFLIDTSAAFVSEPTGSLLVDVWDLNSSLTFEFSTPINAFAIDFLDNDPTPGNSLDFHFNMDMFVDDNFVFNFQSSFDHATVGGGGVGPLFMNVLDDSTGTFSKVRIESNIDIGALGGGGSDFLANFDFIEFNVAAVPEPSAFLFGGLISAVAATCYWVRRKVLAR